MGVIFQLDKRSGVTYAYESTYYWDKEKQQSRSNRKLIGRVNPETGEIEPTDGRGLKRLEKTNKSLQNARRFYGATCLLDQIGDEIDLADDLKRCFPEHYKQILSIAYFLILEDASPLFRFEKWHKLHQHPHGQDIPSQRSSELFSAISDAARNKFFYLQSKRRSEKEFWVYDTTSISSYSEQLKQVKRGHNKENDLLPQLNLAMVFGEESKLPFYYRKLPGNLTDVTIVKQLLTELDALDFGKPKLVMDRGFYSSKNVNHLLQDHIKFLLATKMSLKFIQQNLTDIYDDFRTFEHYHEGHKVYTHTVTACWNYTQARPYKKDVLNSQKRLYIHYYYNITKAAEKEQKFDSELNVLRQELLSGKFIEQHKDLYDKYFIVYKTPKRGIKVEIKEDAVKNKKRYMGFFALISNEKMTAIEALNIYRNKDVVEKAFGNLKERLNFRRALVSSEESLNGKLFVEFVALIYLSELQKRMRSSQLFEKYTIQGVLDELDLIECYQAPGKKAIVAEVTKKQRELYKALGVTPPSSLGVPGI